MSKKKAGIRKHTSKQNIHSSLLVCGCVKTQAARVMAATKSRMHNILIYY